RSDHIPASKEIMPLNPDDYKVEYAASAKSTCKLTKKKIPKGALRIGKIIKAPNFDGTYPVWMKFSAFAKDKSKVAEFQKALQKGHEVIGLSSLRAEDQEKIKSLMGIVENKEKSKEELEQEKQLAEEQKKLWEIKDQLKKHCDTQTLREILEHNGQGMKKLVNGYLL